ncbi:SDR family NAD(P)-dependent oxidoreductase [Trichormus azollae]|jgi:glucose 1-dehydrogenase|uniref:SDR family NAD(P)-dependent oxidoreductase n=1 Tax=Trichormus azollae TaxID=1164 RepID=UPI0001958CDC|nr:SDR family NAD(P)-dependent oxidoreductase [Trichormus azollae]
MFSQTLRQLATIDILVNNAGIEKNLVLIDMTIAQWNSVIGINLTGQLLYALWTS